MTERMWQLMGWSGHYQAPIAIVGVLRVNFDQNDSPVGATAWLREDEKVAGTWGNRLLSVALDELPAELDVWELSEMEPAVPVAFATPSPEMNAVVQILTHEPAA